MQLLIKNKLIDVIEVFPQVVHFLSDTVDVISHDDLFEILQSFEITNVSAFIVKIIKTYFFSSWLVCFVLHVVY